MSQWSLIFERQWLHGLLLAGLWAGMIWAGSLEAVRTGLLWGIGTPGWFWLAVGLAVGHQVYVWFCWRMQLHGAGLTRVLGGRGFSLYAVGFSLLGMARVVAVFMLAIANRDTLRPNLLLLRILAVIALIPAVYLFYSIKHYFGFKRAFGIDHFEASYRTLPFVRKGIFRFTRNGMYTYGFLLLWVPALWYASLAALWVALFNHLYIWVHYYTTELPDINRIYGNSKTL